MFVVVGQPAAGLPAIIENKFKKFVFFLICFSFFFFAIFFWFSENNRLDKYFFIFIYFLIFLSFFLIFSLRVGLPVAVLSYMCRISWVWFAWLLISPCRMGGWRRRRGWRFALWFLYCVVCHGVVCFSCRLEVSWFVIPYIFVIVNSVCLLVVLVVCVWACIPSAGARWAVWEPRVPSTASPMIRLSSLPTPPKRSPVVEGMHAVLVCLVILLYGVYVFNYCVRCL